MSGIIENFTILIKEMEESNHNSFKEFTIFLKKKLVGKKADLDFTFQDLADISFQAQGQVHFCKSENNPENIDDIIKKVIKFCDDTLKERNNLLEEIIEFSYLYQGSKNTRFLPSIENNPHLLELYRKLLDNSLVTNEKIDAYLKDNKNLNNLLSKLVTSSLFSQITLKLFLTQKQKCLETMVVDTMDLIALLPSRSKLKTVYLKATPPEEENKLFSSGFYEGTVANRIKSLKYYGRFAHSSSEIPSANELHNTVLNEDSVKNLRFSAPLRTRQPGGTNADTNNVSLDKKMNPKNT